VNPIPGGGASKSVSFPIAPAPVITTTSLPDATVGIPYSASLAASGGASPYTWTLTGSAPEGLSLDVAKGAIGGTPTSASGSPFKFSVAVKDAQGNPLPSQTLALAVTAIAITTTALPQGVVNFEYPQQILTATGGAPPYNFSITGGALPAGMNLTSGVIGGT